MVSKHPNFWQVITFPKPSKRLYDAYLKVREKNVYDQDSVLKNVAKEDIYNALLVLSLRDIMVNDMNFTMNRVIMHVKNNYDINLSKQMIQDAVDDAQQLIQKIREEALQV
jgi:fructose-specific phosphotransferase system component IIB